MFQSLVGTLKTTVALPNPAASPTVSIPRKYAKNLEDAMGATEQILFQSLVGTLKTKEEVSVVRPKPKVSIPRRYAKNRNSSYKCGYRTLVSIPRRYAKNLSFCQSLPLR